MKRLMIIYKGIIISNLKDKCSNIFFSNFSDVNIEVFLLGSDDS